MKFSMMIYMINLFIFKGLTSGSLTMMLMSLSAFIVGPIISFVYTWQLTLVVLACSPLLFYAAKI